MEVSMPLKHPVAGFETRKFSAVWFALLVGFIFLAYESPSVSAQEVGATLFGTVTDPAGAAVPEAGVTVTNPETGKTVTATTQTNGGYSVPALTPGNYTVTVEKT